MTNRDKSIDALKFVLICIVMLGHCLEVFDLHKSRATEHIYQFIYLFHMPLFVFISGYFMNKEKSKRSFYKDLLFILETYVIFQLPTYIKYSLHGFNNPINILDPIWAMWYLPSLIVWRVIVYNLPSRITDNTKLMIPVLVLLSVLGGFINYDDFAFQRIITYFPMFMMGYCCKEHNWLQKIKAVPVWLSVAVGVAVVVVLYALDAPSELFYQNKSYFEQPISVSEGVVFRILWYDVVFVVSIVLLPLLFRMNGKRMSYYGQHTLLFYVCHVLFLASYGNMISKLNLDSYQWLSIATFLFLLVSLCLVSRSRIAKYITNPVSSIIKRRTEDNVPSKS